MENRDYRASSEKLQGQGRPAADFRASREAIPHDFRNCSICARREREASRQTALWRSRSGRAAGRWLAPVVPVFRGARDRADRFAPEPAENEVNATPTRRSMALPSHARWKSSRTACRNTVSRSEGSASVWLRVIVREIRIAQRQGDGARVQARIAQALRRFLAEVTERGFQQRRGRACLRRKSDCAKWISARHRRKIRRNRFRAPCGKAPCPIGRMFLPAARAEPPAIARWFRCPGLAAPLPSLCRFRECAAPPAARETPLRFPAGTQTSPRGLACSLATFATRRVAPSPPEQGKPVVAVISRSSLCAAASGGPCRRSVPARSR